MSKRDMIELFLRDVPVQLRVGCCEREKQAPQTVIVSVTLTSSAPPDYLPLGDDLAQVIDYTALHDFICRDLPSQPHRNLLETIAEHVCNFGFRDARVEKVSVKLVKPEIFPETRQTGIELTRFRKNHGIM
ncbi:MAG: dihydroneopterin aldolase [Alphaproteobacteria bacterium]